MKDGPNVTVELELLGGGHQLGRRIRSKTESGEDPLIKGEQ